MLLSWRGVVIVTLWPMCVCYQQKHVFAVYINYICNNTQHHWHTCCVLLLHTHMHVQYVCSSVCCWISTCIHSSHCMLPQTASQDLVLPSCDSRSTFTMSCASIRASPVWLWCAYDCLYTHNMLRVLLQTSLGSNLGRFPAVPLSSLPFFIGHLSQLRWWTEWQPCWTTFWNN